MRWKNLHKRNRRRSKREYVANKWIARADHLVGWYMREGASLVEEGLKHSPFSGPHEYILINGVPRPCGYWQEDMRWLHLFGTVFEASYYVLRKTKKHRYNRQVAEDHFGSVRVSTVFLGLNHQFGLGSPLLFETMVFGDEDWEGFQRRYETKEEALQGHAEVVEQMKHGIILEENSEHVDIIHAFVQALRKTAP